MDFDEDRAFADLEAICALGPRVSGSEGMAAQRERLRVHFAGLCDRLVWQRFEARQTSVAEPVELVNLIASWEPQRARRAIVCAHYDTRPIADREPDPRDWRGRFLGANDGASGVACLMELGRHLKAAARSLAVGVDLVFFDGEEYIFDPERDEYCLGSAHFARWHRSERRGSSGYLAGLLLDMIAGEGAEFQVEAFAAEFASEVVDQVWGIAEEFGCEAFRPWLGYDIIDDHVPLNLVGIPTAVVIDIEYPHWHRLSDTPEHCSRDPLGQVGRVAAEWLRRLR